MISQDLKTIIETAIPDKENQVFITNVISKMSDMIVDQITKNQILEAKINQMNQAVKQP